MALRSKSRRPMPEPGARFRLPELDETAGAMAIVTEASGSLLDGWRAIFMLSEKAGPDTVRSGDLYVIRTKDGRNLTMRVFRNGAGFMLLSSGGGVEEQADIEWVAPVRMLVPPADAHDAG